MQGLGSRVYGTAARWCPFADFDSRFSVNQSEERYPCYNVATAHQGRLTGILLRNLSQVQNSSYTAPVIVT